MCVCVCLCVCVSVCLCFPVLAGPERVVQKCDRSAATGLACGRLKFSFCLVTSLLVLVNHKPLGTIKQLV